MRVKYSQTPPPVLEEADGIVQVTKQLTQVRENNLNTDPIHLLLLLLAIEESELAMVHNAWCQVSLLGFSGAERECVALLAGQPARLVFTIGASLAIR